MLGKLTGAAAEISGTADITSVVRPSEFGQAESLMFVFTEDGETPQFILRSKRDEYCWTDRAFVHLDGTSALSKKRLVKRYLYKDYHFQNVLLETAGTIDLDVEIKFGLRGGPEYSIDIRKTEMAALTCEWARGVARRAGLPPCLTRSRSLMPQPLPAPPPLQACTRR